MLHRRVDPYEPHRVWWTTRSKGTHKKTLNFGGMKFYATNKVCPWWLAHLCLLEYWQALMDKLKTSVCRSTGQHPRA